jgi:hypothetical protein
MSDATLKRKTMAKYNNNSVGQAAFSLNGGCRNQGWVGQTSLSRSLPRTLMRDGVARGFGGRQGTFYQAPIVTSGINYQENSQVIKSSVLDNAGMLEVKTQWVRRPQPTGAGSSVKSDSNHHLSDASDRLLRVQQCTQQSLCASSDKPPRTTTCCSSRLNGIPHLSAGSMITKSVVKNYASLTQVRPVAMTAGDYLLRLHAQPQLQAIDLQFAKTAKTANPCSKNALQRLIS